MMHEAAVDCPYCGERFITLVDTSVGSQSYVEDCQVCCQPIVLTSIVDAKGELAALDARREND
ncbi:MAG: CPXCG motif-containing cysteine-rich protein [Pseudomonadota bacterium]|nr:MAG: CPXCG motif-containing cysteine-rich protein [Pseudomonadota bacterium]